MGGLSTLLLGAMVGGYILVGRPQWVYLGGAPSADCLLPVKDYGNVPCLDLCPRSARNPSPQGDQKTSTLGNIMWHEIVYSGQLFLRCLLCTKRDGRVWKPWAILPPGSFGKCRARENAAIRSLSLKLAPNQSLSF